MFISWREGGGGGAYYPYHHLGCSYPGGRGEEEGLITHITTRLVHILGGRGRGLLPISPLGLFISWREGGGGGAYYPYHHLGCSYPGGRVEGEGPITHITTWVVHILEGGGRRRGLLPISAPGLSISWGGGGGGGAYYPYHHLGCSYPGGRVEEEGLITHITTWVVHILEGGGRGRGGDITHITTWVVYILEGGGRRRGLLPISPLGLFISWRESGGAGAYYPYHHLGCLYPGGRVEGEGLITHITTWVVHILEGGWRGRGLLPISPLGLFISWREGGGGRGLLPISPLGLFISWREGGGGGAYYPYHHLGCSYPGGKGEGGGEGLLPIFILGGSVLSKASICSAHVFQT